MRYHDIEKTSMVNGEGLRCVLWVSGCNHFCKGCQNPVTWNPNDGLLFDVDAMQEIFEYCDKPYCDGLTLSGGDPMYPPNRSAIHALCRMFRTRYGQKKTIWMYTGYQFEDIKDEPVLEYLDVIVDGEYVEELRDVHYMWAGSVNQQIWEKIDRQWTVRPPQWEETLNNGKQDDGILAGQDGRHGPCGADS